MAYRKRTYGRKKQFLRKRPAPIKRAVRKAKAKMFNKRVLRAVTRASETKVVSWRQQDVGIHALTSASAEQSIFCVSPAVINSFPTYTINQGTAQGERVGNKISPTRVTLKGVIRPQPVYNATDNYNPGPMYVVMWIVSIAKSRPDDLTELEAIMTNSFFQNGNTSTGLTGQLIDLTQTVNTSVITVHAKRMMKLGYAQYVSGFGTASANNNAQQYANNDFNLSKMFSMTLKMPKTVTFNDGTGTPSSMRKWWMIVVPYRVDGQIFGTSLGSATGPVPLKMDFAIDFKFKDM